MPGKLGVTSTQRKTMLRNLASDLIWYGKIETTLARAKELQPYVEKVITLAVNSYTDTISEEVTVKDAKGKETTKKIFKDGPKKLYARRRVMALTHDITDPKQNGEKMSEYKKRVKGIKHPLTEKLFNEIAPKYADRAEKLGQGGGYTRIYRLNNRRGDDAEMAIIELVED
ncbi:MAG: 50S ribosomal protein L17 [Candidatus Borkfalkiaceae bacterium]|nr:50S ribosomal protein L17 [Christensenellaceae bacterium]